MKILFSLILISTANAAIIKQKIYQGVSLSYWKITGVSANKINYNLTCGLGLFYDQPTADDPTSHAFMIKTFTYKSSKAEVSGDLTKLCYSKIIADVNTVLSKPGVTPIVYKDMDLAGGVSDTQPSNF